MQVYTASLYPVYMLKHSPRPLSSFTLKRISTALYDIHRTHNNTHKHSYTPPRRPNRSTCVDNYRHDNRTYNPHSKQTNCRGPCFARLGGFLLVTITP